MCPYPWRAYFEEIATSSSLSTATTILVLLNMMIMCMPYYGMTDTYAASIEVAGTIISLLFIIEMGIKLAGLGWDGYWSDKWNALDGTIVSLSIIEMVLTVFSMNISFLRVLRMLRVVRMLRLMRTWKGLYKVVTTFMRAAPSAANLAILILLAIFIFSLLGMQFFGGIFNPQSGYSLEACPSGICPDGLKEKPPAHFDYFVPSMLTVFVLITGEWVGPMEPFTEVLGVKASVFFIVVVLIGRFFLLNLLVAIILTEFADSSDNAEDLDMAHETQAYQAESSQSGEREEHRLKFKYYRPYCLFPEESQDASALQEGYQRVLI